MLQIVLVALSVPLVAETLFLARFFAYLSQLER
jgi:hypothetical protein